MNERANGLEEVACVVYLVRGESESLVRRHLAQPPSKYKYTRPNACPSSNDPCDCLVCLAGLT